MIRLCKENVISRIFFPNIIANEKKKEKKSVNVYLSNFDLIHFKWLPKRKKIFSSLKKLNCKFNVIESEETIY